MPYQQEAPEHGNQVRQGIHQAPFRKAGSHRQGKYRHDDSGIVKGETRQRGLRDFPKNAYALGSYRYHVNEHTHQTLPFLRLVKNEALRKRRLF